MKDIDRDDVNITTVHIQCTNLGGNPTFQFEMSFHAKSRFFPKINVYVESKIFLLRNDFSSLVLSIGKVGYA